MGNIGIGWLYISLLCATAISGQEVEQYARKRRRPHRMSPERIRDRPPLRLRLPRRSQQRRPQTRKGDGNSRRTKPVAPNGTNLPEQRLRHPPEQIHTHHWRSCSPRQRTHETTRPRNPPRTPRRRPIPQGIQRRGPLSRGRMGQLPPPRPPWPSGIPPRIRALHLEMRALHPGASTTPPHIAVHNL